MTQSRFARALLQYLAHHSQLELSEASGVERSIISRIANGRRPPTQEAARAIITGTTGPHRIDLLRAWLEDQIPDRCAGLVTITPTELAAVAVNAKAPPETDEQRALAWLEHQLATNVHAVHMVIDLWRASGSPGLPIP
jgi:transcriptional regulator with XRE-family HTH domain